MHHALSSVCLLGMCGLGTLTTGTSSKRVLTEDHDKGIVQAEFQRPL